MKRRLVRKTDRKYKKPKPGKKRLVKFPRTIVPHPVRACCCATLRSRHPQLNFIITHNALHHRPAPNCALAL